MQDVAVACVMQAHVVLLEAYVIWVAIHKASQNLVPRNAETPQPTVREEPYSATYNVHQSCFYVDSLYSSFHCFC